MTKEIQPGVVWRKDQHKFPYLREQTFISDRRNGPPPIGKLRELVGYENLGLPPKGWKKQSVWRRMWTFRSTDGPSYNPPPSEAVMPGTVSFEYESRYFRDLKQEEDE